jgi:hypothetical protein
MKTMTLPWLVQSTLAAALRPPLSAADGQGVGIFLRVRFEPGSEWISGSEAPLVKRTGRTGLGLHESATVFAPSPVIRRTLKRLAKQAREVWRTDNAAASCAELGIRPEELDAAIQEMAG